METHVTPIMVRAAITQDEWKDLRKLAVDREEYISHLVGRYIREGMERDREGE